MTEAGTTAIIGGGLAGLAAALALREQGVAVELFEARRRLGGRASSFRDATTGELIDFCQHVSMGCCTHLADFCRRAGIEQHFRRHATLHFIGPDGRHYDLSATRGLPAPLHLAPALARLAFLSLGDRIGLARALLRLARVRPGAAEGEMPMAAWLQNAGQSPRAVGRFWAVVLVSALGETLDRMTVAAARKVFVDGFMATTDGYQVLVPTLPLGELYGDTLAGRLRERGVVLHTNAAVEQITTDGERATGVRLAGGETRAFAEVILAAPWRRVKEMLPDALAAKLPHLTEFDQFESSPITGVHLWFDGPLTPLPHAVLLERTADWVFAAGRGPAPQGGCADAYYYQAVISASRHLAGEPREALAARIAAELQAVFRTSPAVRLVHAQVVTEKHAVFSPLPGTEAARPAQATAVPNLFLAGDWTATGWPATMESAVRSGNLAAEAVLRRRGVAASIAPQDPRPARLTRWLTWT